jgi:hypothetical protein
VPRPDAGAADALTGARIQVTVQRSGGFAGMTRTWSVDTDTLDGGAADLLRRLVAAALAMPQATTDDADADRKPAQPDAFHYDVLAVVAAARHHWHGAAAATGAVRDLAEHVRLAAPPGGAGDQ